jgi:chemotaxis protein MotB
MAELYMRRKKHQEEHENLERWLVSYADFITLLFAFFVVMYAISSVNEGKYRVLSDSLINAFKNAPSSAQPVQFEARVAAGAGTKPIKAASARKGDPEPDPRIKKQTENMKQIAQDILKVMAPLVKEGQVKVTQSLRGVTVEINAAVLFDPGQAILAGEPVKVLTAVAEVLAHVPNKIQVEGHTDDSPIGTALFPSNWELSTARASSVVRLFASNGVAPNRMVAVGYADNRPVVPNVDAESRARNRRVTMLIISETQDKVKDIPIAGVLPEPGSGKP